jgi:hypothetical protein
MGKGNKAKRRGGMTGSEAQVDPTANPVVPVSEAPNAEAAKAEADAKAAANAAAAKATAEADALVTFKAAVTTAIQSNLPKETLKTVIDEDATAPTPVAIGGGRKSKKRGGENIGWSLDGNDLPPEVAFLGGYHHGKKHNGNKTKKTKRGGKNTAKRSAKRSAKRTGKRNGLTKRR